MTRTSQTTLLTLALLLVAQRTRAQEPSETESTPEEEPAPPPPPAPSPPPPPPASVTTPHIEVTPYVSNDPRPYYPEEGVPDGYRLEESPRIGLVVSGAVLMSALWITSASAAVALDREDDGTDDPNFDDKYWPMFIPVVGPFVTIKTADSSGTGAAILALDGAAQAVGLGMFIAGFAAPKRELVPKRSLRVTPTISPKLAGLSASGTF